MFCRKCKRKKYNVKWIFFCCVVKFKWKSQELICIRDLLFNQLSLFAKPIIWLLIFKIYINLFQENIILSYLKYFHPYNFALDIYKSDFKWAINILNKKNYSIFIFNLILINNLIIMLLK